MKSTFLFLMTMVAVLPLAAMDVPEPYARWTMESVSEVGGTRTIADLTGGGRSLALGAGCSLTNDSPSGNGLYFNGEQAAYATFSHPAMNSRTIAFWVKLDAEDGSVYTSLPEYWVAASQSWKTTFPYLVGDFGRTRLYYQTRWDNVFYVGSGRASEVDKADQVFSCGDVGANFRKEWNFVTLVYDQSDTSEDNVKNVHMSLYLNGSLYYDYGTKAVTNACETGTATLGNVGVNGSRPMKGVLDDVAVWDVALTAEEVFALYAPKFHPTDKRLLAAWDCDEIISEGGVRTVADSSGNGYDLKLNTGVTATNGVVGCGLAWSGESGAGAKTVAALPQLSDWTFSAWINPSAGIVTPKVSNNRAPRIFQFAGAYGTLHLSGWELSVNFSYVPVNAAVNSTDTPGQGILGHGFWTHFTLVTHTVINAAGTGFESYVTWYMNGVKVGESTHLAANRQYSSMTEFLLGCNKDWPGGDRVFEGAMDDVRIYAGALSDADVRTLYLLPPQPDVGADFAVARKDAVLTGNLADVFTGGNSGNLGGSVEWSLVSAPEGAAEGVVLGAPYALECPVTLPALGTYVFRLTVATSAGERSDEVTVTRIAEPVSNVPPTVSLAASATCTLPDSMSLNAVVADSDSTPGTLRACWSMVSGPGPVYFDPPDLAATRATFATAGEYVLKCEADDGLAHESAQISVTVTGGAADMAVTNGLINYWPLSGEGGPLGNDVVGGRTLTLPASARWVENGRNGYGVEVFGDAGKVYTGSSAFPDTSVFTVACWIYHDTTLDIQSDTTGARLFSYHYANNGGGLEIQYEPYSTIPKILLRMKWNTGVTDTFTWHYPAPSVNMRDRWTHVAAVYRLGPAENARTDCVNLYIDGTEMTLSELKTNESVVVSANVLQPYFPGVRKQNGVVYWGGTGAKGGRAPYNRLFPGRLDDMRIYGRVLSAGEISRLAKTAPDANLPPQISVAETNYCVVKNRPLALSALCLDDGRPSPESLSGTWRIVAGDASGVEIANDIATFSTEGCYQLEYVVTDGEWQTGSCVITVQVLAPGLIIVVH
jgi:hypothetical protein